MNIKSSIVPTIIILSLISFLAFLIYVYSEKKEASTVSQLVKKPAITIDTTLNKLIDLQINTNLQKYSCPGVAVLVLKNNEVIFEKQYGTKSLLTNAPIDKETVFRLGSVSKGFAGILAAILIDKKMLNLDDPISMYIPELTLKAKTPDRVLRVKHILTHTSGLTEHAFSNLVDENRDMPTIIKYLNGISPRDSTGKAYAYQNAAFGLIERVVEKATNMSYQNALDYYIFSPLEMCGSSCTFDAITSTTNYSSGHKYNGNKYGFKAVELSPHYYNVPSAGGVNAPIVDMKKWLGAVMGYYPYVISPTALTLAFTPYISTSDDDKYFNKWPETISSSYGLGWRIIKTQNNNLIYHGGLVNGFRTEIAFDKEKNIGIVLLFNSTCAYSNLAVPYFFQLLEDYRLKCDLGYIGS